MQQIIECVPNFSNGRNPEIYNGIADVIRGVTGVRVLGVSADPDHNRTVITYVGDMAGVEEAAFRAIAYAAEHINLDQHNGEHPRIGATDVFPFIPIKGATVADCVVLVNRLGQRVGNELGVAVYLYGDAAFRPERKKLSDIRKGEYELWKAEVATNPARQPDFGPAEPKPWGATVIGVRPFLIAYNIYLNSDNVEIADQIARDIRFIGGGLRFLQAKGFLVEGQAQVSMNLTDFEKTPIYRVQEMVRREAARYGLSITKAELVGLTPQKAFMDAAQWYLQVDGMNDDQVLEYRLQEEAEKEVRLADFVAAAASGQPTPGGGSVAALAGALAAALAQMVAGLTTGRKKYATVDAEAQAVLAEAETLRLALTKAIDEDAAAFEAVMIAFRSKELDELAKAVAVEQATIGAGTVPLRVARLSRDAANLARQMAQIGNVNAVSDAAAGAIMAHAAVQAAALNVKINSVGLQDRSLAQQWTEEVDALEAETAVIVQATKQIAAERGGFA
ncbi:MAG: glutamate formimidoyltransferase [Ardenticatenaceae bacterium]|nr:glutamate formimidoyltransferase [Ardenticatenaceae bacterium]MCB9442951.1 glutamate formimidoyltransferase [Ardenticatenaceae bacterium]